MAAGCWSYGAVTHSTTHTRCLCALPPAPSSSQPSSARRQRPLTTLEAAVAGGKVVEVAGRAVPVAGAPGLVGAARRRAVVGCALFVPPGCSLVPPLPAPVGMDGQRSGGAEGRGGRLGGTRSQQAGGIEEQSQLVAASAGCRLRMQTSCCDASCITAAQFRPICYHHSAQTHRLRERERRRSRERERDRRSRLRLRSRA